MDTTHAIEAKGLKKSYGSVQALRDVTLDVPRGEIFGFLGPNGSGKTTTIRCILDLIRPNGGLLRVFGIDPQVEPVKVRERVGYLPGELHFDENLSAEGVIHYLNALRGGKADMAYARNLAARLDLNLKTAIKNLSKGNKQKVGIIQALMHRPELLLLDEPTSGLDPLMQQEVLNLVAEAQRQQGATVFFSSHIINEVEEIAGQVGIIRRGEVVEVAQTQTLTNRNLRRARVRFQQPVDCSALEGVPGVKQVAQDTSQSVSLQVEGDMDALVKALAAYPVSDLETEKPSLEEIFLTYYA